MRVALTVALLVCSNTLMALAWYGRDAYYQAKVLWQEKHYVPKNETPRPGPAP